MSYIQDTLVNNDVLGEIEKYIENIIFKYKNQGLDYTEYNDILFFCAQLINQDVKEIYIEELKLIITKILSNIEDNIDKCNSLFYTKMIGGLGQFAYSINTIYEQTNDLQNLSRDLNQTLLDNSNNIIDKIINMPTIFMFYDGISGFSGILYYLLDCNNITNNNNIEKINNLIKFLIGFSRNYKYKNNDVIKFHIKKDEQYLEEEKETMKNGHINFGVAHGMMGTLITLSKAKFLGYNVEGLDKAIKRIIDLYEEFCVVEDNNILKFPTKLPLECYVEKRISNISINSGWCYGNLSIVRGLMKAYKYLGVEDKYRFYSSKLLDIINQPVYNYNLSSPILCHGYSSVITIQISAYKETKDILFLHTLNRNISMLLDKHRSIIEIRSNKIKNELLYGDLYKKDISLLEGSGGVILTLVNSITFRLTFDKILLID